MSNTSPIEQFAIDKVREIRLIKNVSQISLSLDMGLSSKFIGNVESPKRNEKYNLDHLNKIAEILHCSIKDFFPDEPIIGELEKTYTK
jgi:transcriptional regulator with XRE-family HTH domain